MTELDFFGENSNVCVSAGVGGKELVVVSMTTETTTRGQDAAVHGQSLNELRLTGGLRVDKSTAYIWHFIKVLENDLDRASLHAAFLALTDRNEFEFFYTKKEKTRSGSFTGESVLGVVAEGYEVLEVSIKLVVRWKG